MRSVSEARYCARAERCVRYDPQTGKSEKLSRYNKDDICARCQSIGDTSQDVPEEHRELFQAAHALFEAQITKEDTIYRTLVCAAWADLAPAYKQMRDKAVQAGESSEPWRELHNQFTSAFDSLVPYKSYNRVLVVRRPPIRVSPVEDKGGNTIKEMLIEVHDRSAGADDVWIMYEKCLNDCDLSYHAGRAVLAYYDDPTDGILRILARPEQEPSLHESLRYAVGLEREQGIFPEPKDVADFYTMLRGRGYPTGRQGGSGPKHYNLIPACVAWYVGGREAVVESDQTKRRRQLAETRKLIKKYLTNAFSEEAGRKVKSTLPRDLKVVGPHIEHLEQEINRGQFFWNANLRDSRSL